MHDFPDPRSWRNKFADALRGVKFGVRGQSSFFLHFFAAAVVITAAVVLQCNLVEWCLLALCIAGVLTAEMFNSALEAMAKAISRERDPYLGQALDIGSGAVLLASLGAAAVGVAVFIHRIGGLIQAW